MTLVEALVTTLRDWGLDYLFGVSGANIEHVHDAVHRLGGSRFRSVCAKSEVGAAFMADCRSRVHRTLGVCCSTSGGGMMNLAVGVAEAFAESVPLLALVGQSPRHLNGRGAFQDSSGLGRSVNGEALWGAIAKFWSRITEPGQFWPSLTSAVRSALSGRPGPAVLLIPRDLYECEVGPRPAELPHDLIDLIEPTPASSEEIRVLFDAITSAASPVLLLGSGVDRCSDPGAVVAFARRLGLRVATTLASKAVFPNDDPLYLGHVGVTGEPSVHRFLQEETDLLIAVGTGLNVMTRQPIAQALQPERLAVVNIDMGEILAFVRPRISVEADAGEVCAELLRLTDLAGIAHRTPAPVPAQHYTALLAPNLPPDAACISANDPSGDLRQSVALGLIAPFLPTVGHVLFDAGNCAAAALHYLRIPPGVSATIALGMGGMGYAIPAAVGAQLGSPAGSRTLVLCGDGAFLILGTEVHTAVHYRLPILFIVFNNGMHGMCVTRQQLYFGSRIESVRYPHVSIATMARGLGSPDRLWVGAAETADELRHCLREYHTAPTRPGVLELRLQHEEVPPFTPFLTADAPLHFVNS